ncbi:MAG: thermonuclease family protein [Limnohabitans sp.]|nr:thermonuclease family protein [Limnohabitans sp.]
MKTTFPILALILLLLAVTAQYNSRAQANNKLFGLVVGVMDGDTYDLLTENKRKIRVRMHGIDAPEKGMPFNKVAKKFLSNLIFNKKVSIIITDEDNHGRIVAKTYTSDGKECGEELLKAGLAWHYKKYNSEKKLAQMEIEARRKKIGIWSDANPIAPWEIRKLRRQGISTKSKFNLSEANN